MKYFPLPQENLNEKKNPPMRKNYLNISTRPCDTSPLSWARKASVISFWLESGWGLIRHSWCCKNGVIWNAAVSWKTAFVTFCRMAALASYLGAFAPISRFPTWNRIFTSLWLSCISKFISISSGKGLALWSVSSRVGQILNRK